MRIWGWRMIRSMQIFAVLCLTNMPMVAQSLGAAVRETLDDMLVSCVTSLNGSTTQAFSEWIPMPASVPRVYSVYEKFQKPGTDFQATYAVRDNLARCSVIRIGDGVVDRQSSDLDEDIYRNFLTRPTHRIANVVFGGDAEDQLSGCIAGRSYILSADLAVRTGNAIIKLVPVKTETGAAHG